MLLRSELPKIDYLNAPVLEAGEVNDLIFEKRFLRIWRSRLHISNGMPFEDAITIEQYNTHMGRWHITHEFNPRETEIK